VAEKQERPEGEEPAGTQQESGETASRFPELDELQRDIERRLRDNQRFLERFLDDDFEDESEDQEEGDEGEEFEEL